MKYFILIYILIISHTFAEELQVKSQSFYADEKKGISFFEGNVNIIKGKDELNASKVTIYTDKDNHPTKFITKGNSSFKIFTKAGVEYNGKADKLIYYPKKKAYHFYKDVHLVQVGEKKEILGEEVVLNIVDGKAHAKSSKREPVIMIFTIKDTDE